VLDPDPACLARFSRWVRRVHRCPPAGSDPRAYLDTLERLVSERRIDAVLPTHEQAWLLARAGVGPADGVPVALADATAFERVQSKLSFAALLDELALPQPRWRAVSTAADLADLAYPYWLKSAFSTAGQGVREVRDAASREAGLAELLGRDMPLMAQASAVGHYGQVQGLFDHGRLVAVHTSVQRGVGIGGSAAARLSVEHPLPRAHIALLGERLAWHGGLTLDYIHLDGSPSYLECNPRTVEPGNAAAAGVNLPALQLRLTLGQHLPDPPACGRPGIRTHGAIALLLGRAARSGSRIAVLRELGELALRRGVYGRSAEQLTPVLRDLPSLLPAAFVAARLLADPAAAERIAGEAVSSYSVDHATIEQLETPG
jgi:hypothetical protein